jgi:hypothetical protein
MSKKALRTGTGLENRAEQDDNLCRADVETEPADAVDQERKQNRALIIARVSREQVGDSFR